MVLDRVPSNMKVIETDISYAYRHAFNFASLHVTQEDAEAYASYYVSVIEGEPLMRYWPGHSQVFMEWRRKVEEEGAKS